MPEIISARAYRAGVLPGSPPESGELIAAAAERLVRERGWMYAKAAAPVSALASLSGNVRPGVTSISWLAGRNKCNQFAGDALTEAGFAMPTLVMPDGSRHYQAAEALPKEIRYFAPVCGFSQVRPGDLMVLDYGAAQGESGAHVEVVVALEAGGGLLLAGAHQGGASLSHFAPDLFGWRWNPAACAWSRGRDTLHFLRPLRSLGG